MSNILSTDFYTEVRKGNVTGHALVHKFGRNDGVGATFEGIHLLSGAFNFLTAASTVRIKAGGNAADTAAGVGAQAITIEGLDNSLNFVSESVATAGGSASSNTSASFWRVFRLYVTPASAGAYATSAGTVGANTGIVTVENSAGGTDLITIGAGEGQSQYGAYAVPTGKTAYFLSATMTTDGNKAADFRCYTRENLSDFSTPFEPKRLKVYFDGILGTFSFSPKSPGFTVSGGGDIWWEAEAGASTEVSIDFELLLVDD